MVVKPTNDLVQGNNADVKDVVHQVVVDGRFIDEFAANPNAVTNQLGITVAKETTAKLTTHTSTAEMYGMLNYKKPTAAQSVGVLVGIVIVGVVVWVLVDPPVVHAPSKIQAAKPVNDPLENEKD